MLSITNVNLCSLFYSVHECCAVSLYMSTNYALISADIWTVCLSRNYSVFNNDYPQRCSLLHYILTTQIRTQTVVFPQQTYNLQAYIILCSVHIEVKKLRIIQSYPHFIHSYELLLVLFSTLNTLIYQYKYSTYTKHLLEKLFQLLFPIYHQARSEFC